ncbi:lantibiotic dehydratase [Catenuloplanes indicus]|uniref:Thiopeptide-type bacteriocin biosynthesis protein n=1 Tax=Catenuloplanes indicus TaxID=137267 RepID=A0AAE4AXE9_9ACTN|nr:lantibiotic dehydratase [Catenuloplanes indicus]MDQ0366945.1 thiopeptide-type bacteriocin biosynthesis protein [Catenuloplanes indicus]
MTVTPIFRCSDAIIVRATTAPADLDAPSELRMADDAAVRREGAEWLKSAWSRADVRDAIMLASPSLAAHLDRVTHADGDAPVKDLRRAVLSLAGYVLRWQRRVTPFGVFAGVALADGGAASASVGLRHRAIARADSEWLLAVISVLERHVALRQRLYVVADSTSVVRDGRLITALRAERGGGKAVPLREASVRFTRPVQAAMRFAVVPRRFDDLVAALGETFPAARTEQMVAVVEGLLHQGFLLTNMRPPMTVADALPHLIGTVITAGGRDLNDVAPILEELEAIRDLLQEHNMADDPVRAAELRGMLAPRMRGLVSDASQVLAVDTRLDAHIRIPRQVLIEASQAADVLLRVSTKPFGSTAWQDYRSRFRARYGQGALVPVRELVSDSSLGFPAGYLGAPRAHPSWRGVTERDAVFLALVQRAALDSLDEIVLTDADVDALSVGESADVIPPSRIELGVAVHARSLAALDQGHFRVRFAAAPGTPTSMAGRFIHLFAGPDRARLTAACAASSPDDDAVAVQLSFPPRRPYNENVARVPQVLPDVVPLAEHPTGRAIALDDLAVTADADQMYLVQISTGRRVIPNIPHALDTVVQSPPLARFLAEVADARTAVFGPFDVGAARTLPYLPRVRYRRTILAPARWLLNSTDVPADQADRWEARLQTWRERWRVPARIVLCHGELRQPLDLDHHLDQALLRYRLVQAGRVELYEDADVEDHGWIGRPAELLIPMTAVSPPRRSLPDLSPPGEQFLPGGSTIIQARLAGNPARFDDIIRRLPAFTTSLTGVVGRWWILRQRDLVRVDADQHLILVLRLHALDQHPAAAAALAEFAAGLMAQGLPGQLSFVPYQDQPGRYGRGEALTAAESVFGADTTCAVAQIGVAATTGIPAQALAAVSMTRIAAAFAPDAATGYQNIARHVPRQTGPSDRALNQHTLTLVDTTRTTPAPPWAAELISAWEARDAALGRYFRLLARQRNPAGVLPTLLRDHHVRALGLDPAFEKVTHRLARAAAQRALARGQR